jgi:hypothetical protein
MQIKLSFDPKQLLETLQTLPINDLEALQMSIDKEIKSRNTDAKKSIQNLILDAPKWSENDVDEFEAARALFKQSRLS